MAGGGIRADIAVIGGGVAGLTAALSADAGLRVAVFVKRTLGAAASAWAQGGIAAAVGADDNFDAHIADTLAAGDGLCDEEAVRGVVREAPAAIDWLAAQGAPFNTAAGGGWAVAREGGHSRRRIVHADDRSGEAVMRALRAAAARRDNITVYENHLAVDLFTRGGRCRGFYALDLAAGAVRAVSAGATVLAAGGAGRVYLYSSTPQDATGDGIAMAYRAGCRIANMEFFQFHPTCLYHPHPPTLLVSEAVRGEGGRLVNAAGESFTADAGGDLASRDVVARAIDAEMKRSGADCVYLDCRARGGDFWRRRFPTIFAQCRARGIDMAAEAIPVVPAAHYSCGGVRTDACGRTDVAGLYAAGETADCGLHGANRLASNSLLECVVMGRRVAAAAGIGDAEAIPAWNEERISPPAEEVMIAHNWEELRRIMWNYVGIARGDDRLQRARQRVEWIRDEISEHYRRHLVGRDLLELRNLAQCAELIIEGALARRESRGLHYNISCPEKKAKALPTLLSREDFARRRRAVNARCPFSRRLITAAGVMRYREQWIGFCNAGCRDMFAAAAADNFASASPSLLAARDFIDAAVQAAPPAD